MLSRVRQWLLEGLLRFKRVSIKVLASSNLLACFYVLRKEQKYDRANYYSQESSMMTEIGPFVNSP
jgi:hypothetical protein